VQTPDHHIISTLKALGIYITRNRIAVLKVLMQSSGAISVASIRSLSPVRLDRVSIYRTLKVFLERGVIFIVPNSNGIPYYMMKAGKDLSKKQGAAFFICTHCGASESLEEPVLIEDRSSVDRQIKNRYVVLEGICIACKVKIQK
jgi:Fur family transcriptional regulator, ferric uptake regulator